MRHTKSHRNNRRSHHALKVVALSRCTHCGEARVPYAVCINCGWYKDRQVLDVLKKLDKKAKKEKQKELEEAEERSGQKSLDAAELSKKS